MFPRRDDGDSDAAGRVPSVQAVDKALAVLDALSRADARYPASLAELSRSLGYHRSSVQRSLASLLRAGYVDVEPEGRRYRLAPKVLRLWQQFCRRSRAVASATSHLVRLRDVTGETAFLSLLVGDTRVVVAQEETLHDLRRLVAIGVPNPLHVGAAGKAILAFASADMVERVLRGPLPAIGPRAATDPEHLREQLELVRQQGYAASESEITEGVFALCAPVFDYSSRVVGSIGVTGPLVRWNGVCQPEFVETVKQAGTALSRELGYNS